MRRRLFALFFCLFLTAKSFAANYAYYFGGGGERGKKENLFNSRLGEYSRIRGVEGWQTAFYTDTKNPSTKKALAELKIADAKDFTEKNFEDQLSLIQERIQSGGITPKDQVLIILDTHGGPDGETLNLATTNGKASISRLEALANLAKERGIPLGIVADNCYSGLAQKLASDSTCVISSTQADKASTAADAPPYTLLSFNPSAQTMEDSFLQARSKISIHSFPIISSPEGAALNSLVREYADSADTIELIQRENRYTCNKSRVKLVRDWKSADLKFKEREFANIRLQGRNLTPHGDLLSKAIEDYKSATDIPANLLVGRRLCITFDDGSEECRDSLDKFVALCVNIQQAAKDAEEILSNKAKAIDSATRKDLELLISRARATDRRINDVDMLNYRLAIDTYDEQITPAAQKVVVAERSFYDEAYSTLRKQRKAENACSKFKLRPQPL